MSSKNNVLQIYPLFRYLGAKFQTENLVDLNPTIKKLHMKFRFILSFLLLTVCVAAFAQEKQSRKAKKQNPAIVEKGLIKVLVMYPFAEGKTFNMEYYETKHM